MVDNKIKIGDELRALQIMAETGLSYSDALHNAREQRLSFEEKLTHLGFPKKPPTESYEQEYMRLKRSIES